MKRESKPKKIELKVEITPLRIKRGMRGNCGHCPVAIGLRVAGREAGIPGWRDVYVRGGLGIGRYRVAMPAQVKEFVRRFDSGFPVAPFTFTATFTECP